MCANCSKPDQSQKLLLELEVQWAKASSSRNTNKLNDILADDFVETDCNGMVRTKNDLLDAVDHKRKHYRTGLHNWFCMVRGEREETAICVGDGVIVSELSDLCLEVHFTDAFENRAGKWEAVSSKQESTE